MKRIHLLAVICATAAIAACSNESAPLKWTEDVRLPDGRVVTLTRYQEFKGWRNLGETPSVSDYWFEFKNPATGQVVKWKSDRDLTTLALIMNEKVPELLVMPNFGGFDRKGCPNPPYLLYRYEELRWIQVPVDQISIKRLRVNMTFDPDAERQHIKAANYRLTVDQTGNSEHDQRPFIINFALMTQQTFKAENCGRTLDWLIEK